MLSQSGISKMFNPAQDQSGVRWPTETTVESFADWPTRPDKGYWARGDVLKTPPNSWRKQPEPGSVRLVRQPPLSEVNVAKHFIIVRQTGYLGEGGEYFPQSDVYVL